MTKQQPKREKTSRIQEKDLSWVKGSSGYNIASGKEDDGTTPGTAGGDPGGG